MSFNIAAQQVASSVYASHFGVYALIMNDQKDKMLLIKKALGCYTGLYDLPGSSMEPHEVLEETDCTVTAHYQLCTLSTLYPHQKNGKDKILRRIGTIYTAKITGTPRTHSTGTDDSHGCVWVALAEISSENAAPFVIDALKFYESKT